MKKLKFRKTTIITWGFGWIRSRLTTSKRKSQSCAGFSLGTAFLWRKRASRRRQKNLRSMKPSNSSLCKPSSEKHRPSTPMQGFTATCAPRSAAWSCWCGAWSQPLKICQKAVSGSNCWATAKNPSTCFFQLPILSRKRSRTRLKKTVKTESSAKNTSCLATLSLWVSCTSARSSTIQWFCRSSNLCLALTWSRSQASTKTLSKQPSNSSPNWGRLWNRERKRSSSKTRETILSRGTSRSLLNSQSLWRWTWKIPITRHRKGSRFCSRTCLTTKPQTGQNQMT